MPGRDDMSMKGFKEGEQTRLAQSTEVVRAAWFNRPDVRAVNADLRSYGEGVGLASCPALRHLVTCPDAAHSFVSHWVRSTVGLLALEPLAQCVFSYHDTGSISVVQLAECGAAELALFAYEPNEDAGDVTHMTARFAAIDRHEICMAGRADIACVTRRTGCPYEPIALARRSVGRGDRIVLRGADQAKVLEKVESRLVILRLSRADDRSVPIQEVRLSDGAIVHQSSGDKQSSCNEVAIALLTRMHRKDAIPALTRLAKEGDEHLRWEAMRHCLALDAGEGVALLAEMARGDNDPLVKPAKDLLHRLRETYPQLHDRVPEPCRG